MKTNGRTIMVAVAILAWIVSGVLLLAPLEAERLPGGPMAPGAFDGVGVLNDIRSDSVVVNDIFMRLAPDVVIRRQGVAPGDPVTLRRGDKVGYVKDARGRVAQFWLLLE